MSATTLPENAKVAEVAEVADSKANGARKWPHDEWPKDKEGARLALYDLDWLSTHSPAAAGLIPAIDKILDLMKLAEFSFDEHLEYGAFVRKQDLDDPDDAYWHDQTWPQWTIPQD